MDAFNNYQKWADALDNINLYDDIKELVLNLVKSSVKIEHYMYKIKNKHVRDAFLNIGTHIVCSYDIEFQACITDKDGLITKRNDNGDTFSIFPREFGMLIFVINSKNDVYFIGKQFINFVPLYDLGYKVNDIRYIQADYATVSDTTLKTMKGNDKHFKYTIKIDENLDKQITEFYESDAAKTISQKTKDSIDQMVKDASDHKEFIKNAQKIDKIIKQISFNIFGRYLDDDMNKIFINQLDSYYNDIYVKERLVTTDEQKQFLKSVNDLSWKATFIGKGREDINALQNIWKLLKMNGEININLYDIEIFNQFSKNKFKSAQLEKTYYGITSSSIYKKHFDDIKKIKKVTSGTAHNPVTDSYYALVVALMINLGINKLVSIGGNITYYKYINSKNRYIQLKQRLLLD